MKSLCKIQNYKELKLIYKNKLNEQKDFIFSYYLKRIISKKNNNCELILTKLLINKDLVLTKSDYSELNYSIKIIKDNRIKLSLELVYSIFYNFNTENNSIYFDLMEKFFDVVYKKDHISLIKRIFKDMENNQRLIYLINIISKLSKRDVQKSLELINIDFAKMLSNERLNIILLIGRKIDSFKNNKIRYFFIDWLHESNFNWLEGISNGFERINTNGEILNILDFILNKKGDISFIEDLYNYYKKKNIDISEQFMKYFWVFEPIDCIKNNKNKIIISKELIKRICRSNIDKENKNLINLIELFNNSSFMISRSDHYLYLVNYSNNISMLNTFIKGVNHNFIENIDSNQLLTAFSGLFESFYKSKKENKAYKEFFDMFFYKTKNNKIHLIEIFNEAVIRGLDLNKNKFYSKMKIVQKSWIDVYQIDSLINVDNFDSKSFIPMYTNRIINLIKKCESFNDFIVMFGDKPLIKKNMIRIYNNIDIYKLWIVDSLIHNNFNYDLINDFLDSEIEYPIYEIINKDLNSFISDMKKYYSERRLVDCLKKPINIQLLEDVCYMIPVINKHNSELLGLILPKKPKDLMEIVIAIKRTHTQISQKNEDLNQDKIMCLNNKTLENFVLWVPKTHFDLVMIGANLGQCVGDGFYTKNIKKGTSAIVVVLEKNKIKYCIELNPKGFSIKSSGGYKNDIIEKDDYEKLKKFIKSFYNHESNID